MSLTFSLLCFGLWMVTAFIGLIHLFMAVPWMLVSIAFLAVTVVVVVVCIVRSSSDDNVLQDGSSYVLSFVLLFLAPAPFVLLCYIRLGNWWG